MAKSQTGNATNDSKNLVNQAQGFAGPGSSLYQGIQSSLGTQQGNQAALLNDASSGFKRQQATGGYDPSQLGTLRQNTANLASTGGYDPASLSKIQSIYDTSSAGYGDLASTGGFTPAQAQAYVRQATEGTTGTYGILENQVQQDKAKTGGLGSGGEISQMARQLGQAQSQNTLAAENSLNQLQTSNKLAGLGGLNTTATSQSQLASALANAKAGGTAQQIGLESGVAAGSNAANQGLSGLYSTTSTNANTAQNQLLASLGLDFSTQEGAINALTQLSKNPGLFTNIMNSLSSIGGGIAGGIAGATV